jgi:hypothetical protein
MITEIESAAENKYPRGVYVISGIDICDASRECFRDGAVWALERTYTEEEVYSIVEQAIKDCYTEELQWHYNGDYRNLKEWFEKCKKK